MGNPWSDGTSPALGVGTNYARPSYKDGQNSQGFLQDLEQSFRQSSFTQKPPNFTPIPLPQALRSSNLAGQPLSTLVPTTPSPPSQFQPKRALKPPTQLAGWIKQLQTPFLHKNNFSQPIPPSAFYTGTNGIKVPSVLDLYGEYGPDRQQNHHHYQQHQALEKFWQNLKPTRSRYSAKKKRAI